SHSAFRIFSRVGSASSAKYAETVAKTRSSSGSIAASLTDRDRDKACVCAYAHTSKDADHRRACCRGQACSLLRRDRGPRIAQQRAPPPFLQRVSGLLRALRLYK